MFLKYLVKKMKNKIANIKIELDIKKMKKNEVIWKRPFTINCFEKIKLGTNIYIGPEAFFMAKGGITIGNNVRIGPKCSLWTENHNYKSIELLPYDYNDISKNIIIHDNVWIGMNVSICPGVEIGEGAIIGMGSVIRGNVPKCAIIIGNPGKIVGTRNIDIYNEIKKNGKFHKLF